MPDIDRNVELIRGLYERYSMGDGPECFLENLTDDVVWRSVGPPNRLPFARFRHGPDEVRAWTIRRGTKAPQAAGKIHSDFERGFIRAEVTHWKDLIDLGSEAAVKAKGLLRVEGKEYVVADGDVIYFRFNV